MKLLVEILSFARIEVLIGLSAIVSIATKLLGLIPVEWTTNNKKKIVFVVATFLVAVIGYREGASIAIMAPLVPTVAWLAMGLYDTVKGVIEWLNKKI